MSDHTSDQEAVSAPVTAAVPGVASAVPPTGMAGLTAMGNQAFGAYANLGSVLSRAILSDPEKATRAPWVSLRGETDQAIANTIALRHRGDDFSARGRAADSDALVQDGLAGAVAARRGVSRFPPGAQPRMPTAPQPATQPPGSAAQPGAGTQSSIDWAKWFDEYGLNAIRTPLEIARVWPGVGMWTGLASDAINGYTDLDTIKDEDAPVLKTVLVIRNVLNAINNVIGHINYVATLAQDASLASVIGAWINPIVASVNMTLKDIKLLLDLAMGVIDIGIWAAAEQRLRNAGPNGKKAWGTMVAGYKANMIGDLATLLVDCWDAATATEGQGEVAKQITLSAKGVLELVRRYGMTFLNWLQGVFNVWGSGLTESAPAPGADAGGAPAPGTAGAPGTPAVARMLAGGAVARAENANGSVARQAASAALVLELQQVKAGYIVGDTLLEGAATAIPMLIKHQSEQLKVVTGGRDPFQFFRDAGANAIKGLADRAGALEGSAVFATNGKQKADALREGCDKALATVDSMKIPPIDAPGADLLLGPLRGGLDEAKSRARTPIQGLKTNADEVAEFLQIFADGAKEQIAWCRQQLEELSAGLAKCNSFEDIMNLMLAKIQSALGTGTNVNIDDIRAWWKGLGPQIDEAIVWAQGLANPTGAAPPPGAAAASAAGGAAAPPPAEKGGGGGVGAAGAAAGPAAAGGAPASRGAGAPPAPAAGAASAGASPAAGARAAADAAAAAATGAAQAGTPPAAVAGAAGAAPAPPAGAPAGAGAAGAAVAAAATNGAAGGAAGAASANAAPGAPGAPGAAGADAGAAAAAPVDEKVPA